MAIDFKSNINLGKNQLQNALLHPTSTAPGTPAEGQVYFNTTSGDKKLYVYDGSVWIDVTGDIRTITAGTGIGVTNGSGGDAEVSFSHLGLESLTAISSESDDEIFMYDTSLGGAAYLSVNTASGITIDSANNDLKLSSIPNSSLANSSITVAGGAGLTATAGATSLGGTTTIDVGAGTGIAVNADDVAIKNAASFTDNTVLMWDDDNGQLVDSAITDDGTTIELGSDSSTRNVVVSGNLTVSGTTTTVDSTTVNIGDNIIVLNTDETGTPSQDAGIEIERGTETNASFLWIEGDDYWKTSGNFAIGAMSEITTVPAVSKFLIATGSNNVTKYATLGNVASSLGLGNHTILLDAANRDNVQKNGTGEVYEVYHGLGTKYVMVTILDATTFEEVMVETTRPTNNTVKVHFAVAPSDGDYICMTSKVGVEDTANLGENFGDSGGGGTEAP
jgi:hypothetical protein